MSARAHARLAELHAQLAEVYRELASGEVPSAPARPKRRVRPPAPLPDVPVTDIDRARARQALRAAGYRVKP